MIIAQLTDTHVLRDGEQQFLDNNAMLAMAIESLNSERPRPDLVLGTGDLTDWGYPEQYEQLERILASLEIPFLPLVGNHDDRTLTRQTFPDVPWADTEHASWITTLNGITLIGLDSTSPGQHGAVFDNDRRSWLSSALKAASGPVLLALHHPPFMTGVSWMDASGFRGLDRFREVVADFSSQIIRIVCGHFHRPVVTTVAGVTTSVCPSTSFHVALDLDPAGQPRAIRDPRGYQLHLVDGMEMVSHIRYIDTGETPFDAGWG